MSCVCVSGLCVRACLSVVYCFAIEAETPMSLHSRSRARFQGLWGVATASGLFTVPLPVLCNSYSMRKRVFEIFTALLEQYSAACLVALSSHIHC